MPSLLGLLGSPPQETVAGPERRPLAAPRPCLTGSWQGGRAGCVWEGCPDLLKLRATSPKIGFWKGVRHRQVFTLFQAEMHKFYGRPVDESFGRK